MSIQGIFIFITYRIQTTVQAFGKYKDQRGIERYLAVHMTHCSQAQVGAQSYMGDPFMRTVL